jgi:hypothetical protein
VMAKRAWLVLLGTTCLLALLVSQWKGSSVDELAALKYANAQLKQKLSAAEAQLAVRASLSRCDGTGAGAGAGGGDGGGSSSSSSGSSTTGGSSSSSGSTTTGGSSSSGAGGGGGRGSATAGSAGGNEGVLAQELLELHSHWDWRAIAREMLQPFALIDEGMIQNGVRACNENGTMYCLRAQVRNNELFITDYRAVFFDRHYAPARVAPLLDVLRRHTIPDVDIVVAAVDEPRISVKVDPREWSRTIQRFPGVLECTRTARTVHNARVPSLPTPPPQSAEHSGLSMPPPLFSSTTNRAHLDLSWPDFSFFMPRKSHKLRTPPWSALHPKMLRESATIDWHSKTELAVHTGNVGSMYRKRLAEVAKQNPAEVLVNELFIGDHGKIKQTCRELGIDKKGGFQQHRCYMTFVEQCGYKYLLNSASIGYANKFKYLLLCGSVVIYINDGMQHKEFYEYGLLPGVHYVAVDKASDVPAMVRWLKQHDEYARAVALAGRARMATLDINAVSDYMAELLTQYARKQTFRVSPGAGAVQIACEDDLWRHYARDPYWMAHYLVEDNSTCIKPPPTSTLKPPGWGGAYRGSKPRCVASHDLRSIAQPKACASSDKGGPHQPGTSFESFDAFPKAGPRDTFDWERMQPRRPRDMVNLR